MKHWIDLPVGPGWYYMKVNPTCAVMVLVELLGKQLCYSKFKERDHYPIVESRFGWLRITEPFEMNQNEIPIGKDDPASLPEDGASSSQT